MRELYHGRVRPRSLLGDGLRWLLLGSARPRDVTSGHVSVDAVDAACRQALAGIADGKARDGIVPVIAALKTSELAGLDGEGHVVADADAVTAWGQALARIAGELAGVAANTAVSNGAVRVEVPAIALAREPHTLIGTIIEAGLSCASRKHERRIGGMLAERIAANLASASGLSREQAAQSPHRLVWPEKGRGGAQLATTYLKATALEAALLAPQPWALRDTDLARSTLVVGKAGYGKTSGALEFLVREILRRDTAVSLVVIDHSGADQLLDKIGRLAIFAPGGRRSGDLVVVGEPGSIAVNPFHRGGVEASEAVGLLRYIFSDLLGSGSELTGRQDMVFSFCCRLVQCVPGGNIATLMQLLDDLEPFRDCLGGVDEITRGFFDSEFDGDKQYRDTRKELKRRLQSLLAHDTFRAMLMTGGKGFAFSRELQEGRGKVVLVDCSKAGESWRAMGRLMIAMTYGAITARKHIPESRRTPTYIVCDEAPEYFAGGTEDMLTRIVDQARKFGGGGVFAMQGLSQAGSIGLKRALCRCGVQMIGGVEPGAEAREVIANIGSMPESLLVSMRGASRQRPVADFALRVQDRLAPVRVEVPMGSLVKSERMNEDAWRTVVADSARRYGAVVDVVGDAAPDDDETDRMPSAAAPRQADDRRSRQRRGVGAAILDESSGSRAGDDDDWVSFRGAGKTKKGA